MAKTKRKIIVMFCIKFFILVFRKIQAGQEPLEESGNNNLFLETC